MYEFLKRTKRIRTKLKKVPAFEQLMRFSGKSVIWANHFRKNVRKNVDGITYELDLNENIDSSLYMSGCFEQEVTNAINVLTKPGYIIMDVGANVGCHTLRFSRLVGTEGRVFAFEPTSYAYEKIRKNLALNLPFSDNVVLEKMAVSNILAKDQLIRFMSSWKLFGNQKQIHEEIVDFVTIDEYVVGNAIDRVDILKIDVDGFKPEVVEGALDTIRKNKPILFLEVNNTPKVEDMLNHLLDLAYVFLFEENYAPAQSKHEILALVNERPVNSTGFKAANFILIHDAVAPHLLKQIERYRS